jgi:hypothetical protein
MKRIAVLLPWFSFFLREKYVAGYCCLALQISIAGWPLAAGWALYSLLSSRKKPKNHFILRSIAPVYRKNRADLKSTA